MCLLYAGQLCQKGLGSAHGIIACPAAHKQWLGEGLELGSYAKVAGAEALTDLLKHGGRDVYVDLNTSLTVTASRRRSASRDRRAVRALSHVSSSIRSLSVTSSHIIAFSNWRALCVCAAANPVAA
jgi:hypothetical protein